MKEFFMYRVGIFTGPNTGILRINALKANITEKIQAVTADVLARTFQNIVHRVQSCLDANGGHFQHML
jgi:hypothetical protein